VVWQPASAANYQRFCASSCCGWKKPGPHLPVLLCGMIGSNIGIADAGYMTLPLSFRELLGRGENCPAFQQPTDLCGQVSAIRRPMKSAGAKRCS
jgi:hypothetical protein